MSTYAAAWRELPRAERRAKVEPMGAELRQASLPELIDLHAKAVRIKQLHLLNIGGERDPRHEEYKARLHARLAKCEILRRFDNMYPIDEHGLVSNEPYKRYTPDAKILEARVMTEDSALHPTCDICDKDLYEASLHRDDWEGSAVLVGEEVLMCPECWDKRVEC